MNRRTLSQSLRAAGEAFVTYYRGALVLPAVGIWRVPSDYVVPNEFTFRNHPGLLQYHLLTLRKPRGRLLITYWRSASHLSAQTGSFVVATKLPRARVRGAVADVAFSRPVTVWPASPSDALLKLAALVGAVTVCYQAYAVVLSPPSVTATVQARMPIDVPLGGTVQVQVVFTNQSESRPARIDIDAKSGVNRGAVDVTSPVTLVKPGESVAVPVTLSASSTEEFSVALVWRAKAGLMRGAAERETVMRVRGWPQLRWTPFETGDPCRPLVCQLGADLYVGKIDSAVSECRAELTGEAVELVAVTTSGDGGRRGTAGVGPARVSSIRWRQETPVSFRAYPVRLIVRADNPALEWRDVKPRIQMYCEPSRASLSDEFTTKP